MPLRTYQSESVELAGASLVKGAAPLICLPTGSGKSHVIAAIAERAAKRGKVLVLAHRKELLQQNESKLSPGISRSFCCAGLNQTSQAGDVVFASPQTFYNQTPEKYYLVLIDEAHRINNKSMGRYREILDRLNCYIIGLSATPFRLSGKVNESLITEESVFTELISPVSIKKLIKQKFLAEITTRRSVESENNEGISKTSFGEYNLSEASERYSKRVVSMADDMLKQCGKRKKIIIFCCGVEHANEIKNFLSNERKESAEIITGDTPKKQRETSFDDFRKGKTRFLVGVDVFTEGFDIPDLDCVVLMRPTYSAALYIQMVGRGLRVAPGKSECLILDYGGNVERHGPIDLIQVTKKSLRSAPFRLCPMCNLATEKFVKECPDCGFEFPKEERKPREKMSKELRTQATHSAMLSSAAGIEYQVTKIVIDKHTRRAFDASRGDENYTMRVEYYNEQTTLATEYLCFNHSGFPKQKARMWWKVFAGTDTPASVDEALERSAEIVGVTKIRVIRKGKNLPTVEPLECGKITVRNLAYSGMIDTRTGEVLIETKEYDGNSTVQALKKAFPGSTVEYKIQQDQQDHEEIW